MEHSEEPRRPSRRVRFVQWLRWLLKATIWEGVTALLDRAGFTPATVQVLCVDAAADRVLALRTGEYRAGYCPVQGLRRGTLSFGLVAPRVDVREDARRELLEEAVVEAPPLGEFRVAERYREGRYRQFDCTVLVVFCHMRELRLRAETGEGGPCWLPVPAAIAAFGNKTLRDMVADWRDDPVATDDAGPETGPATDDGARSRRFLVGPAAQVPDGDAGTAARPQRPASPAMERFWTMPLLMLDAARKLGARGVDEVYQADPRYAAELWSGMSTAARDCYRPDPRLWRDCRLLELRRVPDLLAGWREAQIERLAERSNVGDARSIPGWATPEAALGLQGRSWCEIALDLIYDSEEDRVGCFLTRGAIGGVMSDVLLYALMSGRYLPIPVFHTHPIFRTAIGYKQASAADFWVMGSFCYRLEGVPVGDCVFFPDGTWNEYGITGHGRCFFRRAGDPLLPPDGEPVVTLVDVTLPERPRMGATPRPVPAGPSSSTGAPADTAHAGPVATSGAD
jgi:hypothetical protein